ncbi:MAG: hypothetical protein ACRD2U_06575 [Terriglobales bacterium]
MQGFGGYPLVCHEILGETLLKRTLNRMRESGIGQPTVLYEESGSESIFPSRVPRAGKFFHQWEAAVGEHLNQGADILVLIRLGAHLEVDFAKLLEFHRESSSILTQVYDRKSAFDTAVVSAQQLNCETGSYRGRLSALIPYHKRYEFSGYANRLRGPQDFRKLAQDGLTGRSSIRPVGREVSPGIWIGDGADVDSTTRITAPAYIGAHTRVKGSCRINGATTIERDCEVDFGTSVTDSSVLPGTYLGVGLNFVHSIVTADRIFHIDRNVEVEISDPNLLGKRRSARTFVKSIAGKDFFNQNNRQLKKADAHLYQ